VLPQLFVNGLTSGAAYALVALGFALVYQTTRFFHLAYGVLYTLAAYVAYSLAIQLGWSRLLAFPTACAAVAIVGGVIDTVVYRPMRRRSAHSLTLLVASLGLYLVLQNLISMIWGDAVRTLQSSHVSEGHALLGARVTDSQTVILATSAVFMTVTWAVLKFTKPGVTLRALGSDPELVRLCGVNDDRYIAGCHMAGAMLAGVAAVTSSLNTDLTPTMGFNALIKGVVSFIIGGTGSLPGAAIGGVLLGVAENLAVWQLPSKWMDAVAFFLLAVFLIFRPQGILGRST
jgi:branched-chain amino acid transport system permease protein